ncbi:MAG: c-type cytochrome domain-containing protein, partial [Planctomycetaceae bacterium]
MNILRLPILLVIASACSMLAAEDAADPAALQEARDLGRINSRFLKASAAVPLASQRIPKANLRPFGKSIGPILKSSCQACHGPKKSEGRLRVDKLDPDLLTGPDVERWREIYNVLGNSEMPPADEPDYALSDADRGSIVDWLGAELRKAYLVRRNNKQYSS